MTDRIYPRPAGVDLDTLLDALYAGAADRGIVGTGNPDTIGISITDAPAREIDAIWYQVLGRLGIGTSARPGDPDSKADQDTRAFFRSP